MDFNALFPDEREKGSTVLEQSQLVMLRMLKILDYLCLKHEITYFLTGGSLLGAIRHKGFIPWDDDLDIGMTRENYDRFVRNAVPELPRDIFFQTAETDAHYPPFDYVDARLRDKYSSYNHFGKKNNKWHEGLQVDIFVYDKAYLPHNFFIITQNFLFKVFTSRNIRVKALKWISKHATSSLVFASNYLQNFGQLKIGTYKTEKELSKLIRTKFEDMEVYIPVGWDAYLKRQFGNYMQLPPEEKRISHHKVHSDPFTPCGHKEILHWKDRTPVENERPV